jgi:hypothetical protein
VALKLLKLCIIYLLFARSVDQSRVLEINLRHYRGLLLFSDDAETSSSMSFRRLKVIDVFSLVVESVEILVNC